VATLWLLITSIRLFLETGLSYADVRFNHANYSFGVIHKGPIRKRFHRNLETFIYHGLGQERRGWKIVAACFCVEDR